MWKNYRSWIILLGTPLVFHIYCILVYPRVSNKDSQPYPPLAFSAVQPEEFHLDHVGCMTKSQKPWSSLPYLGHAEFKERVQRTVKASIGPVDAKIVYVPTIYPAIYLSIHLSINLSSYLSSYPSSYLSSYLPIYLLIYLAI